MLFKNEKKWNTRNSENVIASEIKERIEINERRNKKRKSLTILAFDAPDSKAPLGFNGIIDIILVILRLALPRIF